MIKHSLSLRAPGSQQNPQASKEVFLQSEFFSSSGINQSFFKATISVQLWNHIHSAGVLTWLYCNIHYSLYSVTTARWHETYVNMIINNFNISDSVNGSFETSSRVTALYWLTSKHEYNTFWVYVDNITCLVKAFLLDEWILRNIRKFHENILHLNDANYFAQGRKLNTGMPWHVRMWT